MSFLSRQAKKENKEQDYYLNILRGSKKGKGRASPYPKESPKKFQRKSTSIPTRTPEGTENIRQPVKIIEISSREGSPTSRNTPDFDRLRQPEVIIESHEAGTSGRETGAPQETEDQRKRASVSPSSSRKRRREDDDGIFN
jgi:hypothetical protein